MTKIKICGLTSEKETQYLDKDQIAFAGIVLFCPKSKRNISIQKAKEILTCLNPAIHPVAVTVSPSVEEIQEIQESGFHYLQIHGTLTEDVIAAAKIPILRAFNVTNLEEWHEICKCDKIAGYIFDAQEPGSGKSFDWSELKTFPRDQKLFILAGGLTSKNVLSAIRLLHPDAVDVSSGVENDSGIGKDPQKIAQFVHAVEQAEISTDV